MKPSHLHSAGRGYREPLFPQGGASLSGYGSRLSLLVDFGGRIGTFRCAAAMLGGHPPDKFSKGFGTNHKRLSKISAKFTRLSSPSTFPEGDDEEGHGLEMDANLSYFKGLVLDLSYRYCGSNNNLTIDHVLPVSRGGKWIWENLVTACNECNSKKGHKTLEEAEMRLIRTPKVPKDYDTWAIPLTYSTYKLLKSRERMPDEWNDYISTPLFGS